MIRRPDNFGLALVFGLAVAMIGGGGVVVVSGLMTPSELLLAAGASIALVAGYRPRPAPPAFRNTHVHGDARLAEEHETHAASGGTNKAPELHDQNFDN